MESQVPVGTAHAQLQRQQATDYCQEQQKENCWILQPGKHGFGATFPDLRALTKP